MRKSKLRIEMGEEKWEEYQRQRKNDKAKNWKAKNIVDYRRRVKEKLIAYKGGKCEICGYDKPYPSCYDFHHKDPSQKEFGIGEKGITRSFEKSKKESDKCLLLCRNCHAEIHAKEYEKEREESRSRHQLWIDSRIEEIECKNCNKKFKPKRKDQLYCSFICSHNSLCKTKCPTKEELEKLVWEIPSVEIAKMYGVSDTSVGKWCKKYNISKPSVGYWQKKKVNKT